jgi:hypothetical protein
MKMTQWFFISDLQFFKINKNIFEVLDGLTHQDTLYSLVCQPNDM